MTTMCTHTHTQTHTGTQTHTQAHTDTSSSTEYGNAQLFYFNILFGVVVLYLASWKNLEFGLWIFWWVCGEVLLVQSFWDTEGLLAKLPSTAVYYFGLSWALWSHTFEKDHVDAFMSETHMCLITKASGVTVCCREGIFEKWFPCD